MTVRQAKCSCGNLCVDCEGQPSKVSICNCDACRRRTGSAFGMAAFFNRENVRVRGESKTFTRGSDYGTYVVFHFCPDCGSTIYWEPARKPEMIAVGVGAFADLHFPVPEQSVWDDNRYSWIVFPDTMTKRSGP